MNLPLAAIAFSECVSLGQIEVVFYTLADNFHLLLEGETQQLSEPRSKRSLPWVNYVNIPYRLHGLGLLGFGTRPRSLLVSWNNKMLVTKHPKNTFAALFSKTFYWSDQYHHTPRRKVLQKYFFGCFVTTKFLIFRFLPRPGLLQNIQKNTFVALFRSR